MITAELVREILGSVGVNPERFVIKWASAAEATRYVELITAFTRKIEELGPLGRAEGKDKDDLLLKLRAARSATEAMKLRAGLGKVAGEFREERDYRLDVIKQKLEEKLGPTMKTEVSGQEILLRLGQQGPVALEALAHKVGLSKEETADYLAKFGKKGLVVERDGVWSLAAGS